MPESNAPTNGGDLNFFRFQKIDDKYLLTNDIGRFFWLSPKSFKELTAGKLDKKGKIYRDLKNLGFIRNQQTINLLTERWRSRHNFLFNGPSLHIVIPTLRCNHRCLYCQAESGALRGKNCDMTQDVAKKVVDTIFSAPSPVITIEFQGGEPLLNWPIVKFIIGYAKEKNKSAGKRLSMALVSNLSLMDERKYHFLAKAGVNINTSLDGPEELHNKNRVLLNGNSYKNTVRWIKEIKGVGVLATISRNSLKYPKEIVDEYIKLGLKEIHLRPLSYLGLSGKFKDSAGYSAEEFLDFWKKAMDYIIKNNLKGTRIIERGSKIILQKILTDNDPNYLDLRSPCGAGLGQLAYNFNGKVYTCDEGRMVPDDTFLLGDVKKDNFIKIFSNPTVAAMCMASTLENLPCDGCVFKPYCGVCPVQNYVLYGNIFPNLSENQRCKIQKGMFLYLLGKMENKGIRGIFQSWIS
jgi:His-Xaa-Ser system radical SAM maturase HxsB